MGFILAIVQRGNNQFRKAIIHLNTQSALYNLVYRFPILVISFLNYGQKNGPGIE
jgi:hypothetical protein